MIQTAKQQLYFYGLKLFNPITMHLNKLKSLKVVKSRDENLVFGCQDGGEGCVEGCGDGGGGGGGEGGGECSDGGEVVVKVE